MGEAIITGIFTLLGIALGFSLSKISDVIKERKTRENNQTLLMFNLSVLNATIMALKNHADALNEIKSINDLKEINNVLKIYEANKEIYKLDILFEQSIPLNSEMVELFAEFKKLVLTINALVIFIDSRNQLMTFENAKPYLMKYLDEAAKLIDTIIEKIDKL